MSAANGSERFQVSGRIPSGFSILDWETRRPSGAPDQVDFFRSEAAAHHAASMLNRGIATVDPHAIVGCKVVAR